MGKLAGKLQSLSYVISCCSFPHNTLLQSIIFVVINQSQDQSTEIFTKDIINKKANVFLNKAKKIRVLVIIFPLRINNMNVY